MAEPIAFPALLGGAWRGLRFEPFHPGVEVHYLWRRNGDPVWALLRYAAGASVPKHLHTGLETILVLEGSQSDERGTYRIGEMVCNPAGSRHRVWSDTGCVILIQWERPVRLYPGP
jgi:anti-sigma factor ChrR (cupin superfamily)